MLTIIILILFILLIIAGAVESLAHRRALSRIPIRIHVNGTRGKSSTVRLIAGALREGGYGVVAKTTGTLPQIILEDGSEIPLVRRKPVSILEQLTVVRAASRRGAQVLVMECMGVNPEIQWTLEHRLIRSQIGVITNVREDHLDEMGENLTEIARSLALTIPKKGKLVVGEPAFLPLFEQVAQGNGSRVFSTLGVQVSAAEISSFPYPVFAENVACALKVCELLGVERDQALRGMGNSSPDPGSFAVWVLNQSGREYYLINSLAGNDLTSTQAAWELWSKKDPHAKRGGSYTVGLFNNRDDRAFRISEMIRFYGETSKLRHLFISGESKSLVRRSFKKAGGDPKSLSFCGSPFDPQQLLKKIEELAPPGPAAIFAFGNIKGEGWTLLDYFKRNGEEA